MPKSKHRKNHKQKLESRRNRINETTNIKKKQMKNWIQQMQQQILQKNQENAIDVNAAENVPLSTDTQQVAVEEISQETPPLEIGASGAL